MLQETKHLYGKHDANIFFTNCEISSIDKILILGFSLRTVLDLTHTIPSLLRIV